MKPPATRERTVAVHLEALEAWGIRGFIRRTVASSRASTAAEKVPSVPPHRGDGGSPLSTPVPRSAPLDLEGAPPAGASKAEILSASAEEVAACTACRLCESRTQTVFGVGNPDARVMFVGEAPGRDEDLQGEPFVGRAGQLLDRIIVAMGLRRQEVYIANVLKCRPPNNRDPRPDEVAQCTRFLRRQIRTIRPEVLVALGRPAANFLLETTEFLGRLRGRWHEHDGIPVYVTYHPAYLLRNAAAKAKTWQDIQAVMQRLGLSLPPGR